MEVLNTDHDSVPSDICYKSYIQNLEFVDVLMHMQKPWSFKSALDIYRKKYIALFAFIQICLRIHTDRERSINHQTICMACTIRVLVKFALLSPNRCTYFITFCISSFNQFSNYKINNIKIKFTYSDNTKILLYWKAKQCIIRVQCISKPRLAGF